MSRCLVISVNTTWNLANFRAGLIRALVADGWRVVCLAPTDRHAERVRALGCELIHLPMDNDGTHPAHDLALLVRYWRHLRSLMPAVYLGFTVKPNVYGSMAAHALGIPVINNIAGLGTAFLRGGWLLRVVHLLYRLALGQSRTVFFQNPDDRALFLQFGLVRMTQTQLLPGSGVDLQHFTPRPRARAAGQPLVFLLVARLLWDKGIGEFVEALRLLRESNVPFEARLLGFLDVRNPTAVPAEMVQQWQDEGLISYVGETDDVREALAECDAVVLPSYREGTPRSLLEAAAMAKPLIATSVPGCREVVDDGRNGYLVAARSAHAIADAMARLVSLKEDERTAMADASREIVERRFSEHIVISAYQTAISAAAEKSR